MGVLWEHIDKATGPFLGRPSGRSYLEMVLVGFANRGRMEVGREERRTILSKGTV